MKHKVSVIIPLYNQGQYIDETLNSALSQSYANIEVIVVNDGSTDKYTINKIKELELAGINILHKSNGGLASARNAGIEKATGKYIVALDSDDVIDKDYIGKLVKVLDQSDAKIAYSRALLFGARSGLWMLPNYSIKRMLHGNIIYCSAMYHRSDWVLNHGYDEKIKDGLEDWEFWLSIIERGGSVVRVKEALFYYRIRKNSMLRSLDFSKKKAVVEYIFKKHQSFFKENNIKQDSIYIQEESSIIYRIINKIVSVFLGYVYAKY
ncbi:glycosyltransferase family A protein [Buttiauxella gaviniae]|uniref:Glycosyltransferase family A protein n=1 Tax=Buttiauxella gaviniae TaxID=82990 RepID=A0ABV3NXV7_9ENTR